MSETMSTIELIHALPKIDLHRHLEGSVRLETLVDVAKQYKIELPAYDIEGLRSHVQITPDSPTDSAHFLSKFNVLRRFYYSQEVIQRVTREAVEDAAADNIKYMELRFTPKALSKLMDFSFDQVTRWVCEAVEQAQQQQDIKVRLIMAMNRHEGLKDGERTLDAALSFRSRGIAGLDLAGQEAGFSNLPFNDLFKEARNAGLGITVHAGEWAGPINIKEAIAEMGATRIGHGVRVIEDHRVAKLALERGTYFEVCPTSNVQSGVVMSFEQHPLRDMTQLGLKTTINTDDPSVSNITLSSEYTAAIEKLGMSLNAANCAFLPDDERAELVAAFSDMLMQIN
jgi:adenosine deaminase